MIEHLHNTLVYAAGFHKQDLLFWEKVTAEKNIRLYLNTAATGVELGEDGSILSVVAEQHTTEKTYRFSGKIFIDASGDGRIAFESGADFRMGREAKSEYNESMAPDEADSGTMGSSIFFNAREMEHRVPFTPPEWAYDFPSDDDLPFRDMARDTLGDEKQFTGFWWLEYGGIRDTIADDEEIRDELYKIVYGIWDHMKNHGDHGCENFEIVWMNVMPAKRESRRLLGDYVLHESDVRNHPLFEDRVAYGGWGIDIHPPMGIFSKEPPCTREMQNDVWNIPLRSLYSRNVPNLFMAGRNLSATHVALGSARVMATCALMGQAVGTAAQMCIRYQTVPREIAQNHISELQQQLLRDDCYIKDLANEDPADLARQAQVQVSSEQPLRMPELGDTSIALSEHPAQMIPVSGGRLDWVELQLESSQPGKITLHVFSSERINAFPDIGTFICKAEAAVPQGNSVVRVNLNISEDRDTLYWIVAEGEAHIRWVCSENEQPLGTRLAVKQGDVWHRQKGTAIMSIEPVSFPYSGRNICNGVTRPEKWTNLWISDSSKSLPQTLQLDFTEPTTCNTVQLTFDTDLNTNIYLPAPWGTVGDGDRSVCVKDYDIYGYTPDEQEILLVSCRGNYQRHRIHRFDSTQVKKILVRVLATNGDPSARIYEIRCYDESPKKEFE